MLQNHVASSLFCPNWPPREIFHNVQHFGIDQLYNKSPNSTARDKCWILFQRWTRRITHGRHYHCVISGLVISSTYGGVKSSAHLDAAGSHGWRGAGFSVFRALRREKILQEREKKGKEKREFENEKKWEMPKIYTYIQISCIHISSKGERTNTVINKTIIN